MQESCSREVSSGLLKLANEISVDRIRPLSTGIGLGLLNRVVIKKVEQEKQIERSGQVPIKSRPVSSPARGPSNQKLKRRSKKIVKRADTKASFPRRILFLLGAHIVDLLIVAASLFSCQLGLEYYLGESIILSYREWENSVFGLQELLVLLYIIFSIYFIFFRVSLGGTLGQMAFRLRKSSEQA